MMSRITCALFFLWLNNQYQFLADNRSIYQGSRKPGHVQSQSSRNSPTLVDPKNLEKEISWEGLTHIVSSLSLKKKKDREALYN